MSVIDRVDVPGTEQLGSPTPAGASPDGTTVTLHRRRAALALVGTGALAVAVAYVVRAGTDGPGWGLLVAVALVPVAVLHLAGWVDARDPLLVADRTGLRVRSGRVWTGLRWEDTRSVRLTPTRGRRQDALVVVQAADGSRHAVPLALVDPADVRELPAALRALGGGRTEVSVEASERPAPEPAPEPEAPREPAAAERAGDVDPPEPTDGPEPARQAEPDQPADLPWRTPPDPAPHAGDGPPPAGAAAAAVARADVVHQPVGPTAPSGDRELRDAAPGRVGLVLETRDLPDAPAVIGAGTDVAPAPVDPVVGPEVAAARERLRLSVDDLAERTRIRPHVIEAMEVDDFSACGGDVYARGHLRTLARVLGIDAEPLVAAYDARYASGPVTARRVFEAELAGPGRALRPTGGGPRWSVLIAVVLVLALVWGVARLLVPAAPEGRDGGGDDVRGARAAGSGPVSDVRSSARFAGMGERPSTTRLLLRGTTTAAGTDPSADPTADPTGPAAAPTTTAPPTPAAGGAAALVLVRSGQGEVVFRGALVPGEEHRVAVAGPATVSSPDAGGVSVRVGQGPVSPLGEPGEPARTVFGD